MPITYLKQLYANNAATTLASGVSSTDVAVIVTDGSNFPSPSAGQFFLLTLDDGINIEIIEVYGRTGNTLTGCVRGREGTIAHSFLAGAAAECRVTAATLGQFVRKADVLAVAGAVADLVKPSLINNSSYVLNETDDSGNPILVYTDGTKWSFAGYPLRRHAATAATNGTVTTLTYTGNSTLQSAFVQKGMIIQFLNGLNQGLCRMITGINSGTITWAPALPNIVVSGDQYEVYQSTSSKLASI